MDEVRRSQIHREDEKPTPSLDQITKEREEKERETDA